MKLRWCFLFAMALGVMAGGCNPGGQTGGTTSVDEPSSAVDVDALTASIPEDRTIHIRTSGTSVDIVPREIKIPRGETLMWMNETGEVLSIANGSGDALFGPILPVIDKGGPAFFTVYDDGQTTVVSYEYEIAGKTTDPPPKIIVCPPGGCPE